MDNNYIFEYAWFSFFVDFPYQYYHPPNNFKAWLFNMRIYKYIYTYSTLLYIRNYYNVFIIYVSSIEMVPECWRILFSVQLIHDEINIVILRWTTIWWLLDLGWTPEINGVFSCYLHNTMVFGVEETPIGSQFSLSFARLPPSVDAGLRRADLGCLGADAETTVGEFQLPDRLSR